MLVVGVCSWWPGDVLTFSESEPHWEVISPWSDWAGLDWEDPRVLDADADLGAIEALTARFIDAPVHLSPGTYKFQPSVDWWPEDLWLDLPLFLIKRA